MITHVPMKFIRPMISAIIVDLSAATQSFNLIPGIPCHVGERIRFQQALCQCWEQHIISVSFVHNQPHSY